MKKLFIAIVFIAVSAAVNLFSIDIANAQGPIINIPDANFKAYLIANFDANTDGDIDSTEAANVSDSIDVYNMNIADLTGIEAFTAITSLDCGSNALTSLDVSANTALTYLGCYINQLTSLNVSANTALDTLVCSFNPLTGLDVSTNTALTILSCSYNQLTSLNVSANTALTYLYCFNNLFTILDVSANTALTTLFCYRNQLTSLDVSANTALTELRCYNNQLTVLNMRNGNNANVTYFDARVNPNLYCIQVDSPAYSYSSSSWYKDTFAIYSTNCPLGIESFGSDNEIAIYPNPVNEALNIFVKENEQTEIFLYDILSRKCLQQTFRTLTTMNTAQLTNGIYIYELRNKNGIIRKGKLVKQ